MLWTAYLTAIGAGLSLLLFLPWARRAAPPRLLLPPIVVAALAAAWEVAIPRSANIRIDLLVTVPALALVEGICGIALAAYAIRRRGERLATGMSAAASAICVAASGFVLVASILSGREMAETTARYDRGHELAFQAAFRDDTTQRRVFGRLEGDPDGWAGYYVPEKPDSYPRRIVIAADGRYWTFGDHDFMQRGHRNADSHGRDRFLGKGALGAEALDLARHPDGFTLKRTFGDHHYTVRYRREPPPRYARPASPSDQVRFRGVFSGALGDAEHVRVAQVWIWEAQGQQWGKYLWQGLTPGIDNWIVAQRDAQIDCARPDCRQIVVRVEKEAAARFTWLSPDELQLETYEDHGRKIVLRPGETVPGFLYDLAPLGSASENREWLRAITADVHWTPPPGAAADP